VRRRRTLAATANANFQTHSLGQQTPQISHMSGDLRMSNILDDESSDVFATNLLTGMSANGNRPPA